MNRKIAFQSENRKQTLSYCLCVNSDVHVPTKMKNVHTYKICEKNYFYIRYAMETYV